MGRRDVAKNQDEDEQSTPKRGKTDGKLHLLSLPLSNAFRASFDDNDGSIYSADNENERQRDYRDAPTSFRYPSASPAPARTWKARCSAQWHANRGLAYVLIAQLCGALMNVTARLLETAGEPLNTFQVMWTRMTITVALSMLYMWRAQVDHFPLGAKEVRKLLLARGFGGFFGLLGIYYSLMYLPLGEATVITFLAPIVACWASSVLMRQPFTRAEQIAALVSLVGVVLIARPTSFFSMGGEDSTLATGADDAAGAVNSTISSQIENDHTVTSAQRLFAIGVALIGVLGAACAYTTIRCIGQRAHPLISINYFAAWTTIVASVVLLFVPGMHFKLPSGPRQWVMLIFLGLCGFVMQLMLTTGLSVEKTSRATNMVYTQMLFALAFDKLVFDTTLGALSIVGSGLILGSALYTAVQQEPHKHAENKARADEDEEIGLTNYEEAHALLGTEGRPSNEA